MASVNKVILVGHLGRDPELRHSQQGMAVCNISIATAQQWKDKATGGKREETEWHRVVMYDKLAEVAGKYLQKGGSVYIEGRLKTRKYQDKQTGADRYVTEVIADQMKMLGSKDEAGRSGSGGSAPGRNAYAEARGGSAQASPASGAAGLIEMEDDPIPF